jgi:Pyruvate/2-oxoglutarate dehydrogenase complex, dihydrolipoamide dehydrogenase (E3) component, and related enzymes
MQRYDSIVIGTGQSGPSLARRLSDAGQTVAVIERKFFGGTCVNTGCTPTKTLVASAYAAHLARRATEFGVTIPGQITVDMKAVKARKDYVLGLSRDGIELSLKNLKGAPSTKATAVSLVRNRWRSAIRHWRPIGFSSMWEGRALVPPIEGLDRVDYLTNSSMLDVDELPPHLVILGGSYIGLELAQIYRASAAK